MNQPRTIVLIGMPASGKTTVGRRLARRLGLRFVDTDELIVARAGRSLQQILESDGYLALRAIEEQVILAADFDGAVVATGGSAVYSDAAMAHLASFGPIVFLDIPLELLKQRLNNFAERGIASPPDQTLEEIYREREACYARMATRRIAVEGLSEEALVDAIVSALGGLTAGPATK